MIMHHTNLAIDLPDDADRYINACARIRRISTTRLFERLLKRVCTDQMVLAVLDDDSKQPRRLPGEHSRSHYHRNMLYDLKPNP
jgi:hypothetical protein